MLCSLYRSLAARSELTSTLSEAGSSDLDLCRIVLKPLNAHKPSINAAGAAAGSPLAPSAIF